MYKGGLITLLIPGIYLILISFAICSADALGKQSTAGSWDCVWSGVQIGLWLVQGQQWRSKHGVRGSGGALFAPPSCCQQANETRQLQKVQFMFIVLQRVY